MEFERFKALFIGLAAAAAAGETGCGILEPAKMAPVVLAYIGDAVFTLFVRTRLIEYERDKINVLHAYTSRAVSAAMQARALFALWPDLAGDEREIVRRGRNAKSQPPKSASVAEYKHSTGFEALLGYLFLSGQDERLAQLADKAFAIIAREMGGYPRRKEKITGDAGQTCEPYT